MRDKWKTRRRRVMKGGFIPSIMEGFCVATSKYIIPITLLIVHRMMNNTTASHRKKKAGKAGKTKKQGK